MLIRTLGQRKLVARVWLRGRRQCISHLFNVPKAPSAKPSDYPRPPKQQRKKMKASSLVLHIECAIRSNRSRRRIGSVISGTDPNGWVVSKVIRRQAEERSPGEGLADGLAEDHRMAASDCDVYVLAGET